MVNVDNKGRKMRNPLRKRYKREIKSGFGRYLVLFLLLLVSIGEVSGFLVADNSLITAYDEGFEKYNIEDGNFTSAAKLTGEQINDIESENVTLYENFFVDKRLADDTKLRLFKVRDEVNVASIMEGRDPLEAGEAAIDRLYAKNNDINIGDKIDFGGEMLEITGFTALPDYSCLFESNTDMMFDTTQFGVGIISQECWDKINEEDISYRYSWKYDESPVDETEEKKRSDDFLKSLSAKALLTDYVPGYANQAIMFTGEDFGQDRAMMQILLYIIIVIIAFIFAVTIKNMIHRESGVIGTLLASGFTKGELLFHYMMLPVGVTVAGAVAGNILGYTVMKDINAAAYYGSYSLGPYRTLFNATAFIQTTLIPIGIVLFINFLILRIDLSYPALNFLRGEIGRKGGKKAMRLSHLSPIKSKFRKRIFAGNAASYIVIIIGIFFSNVLLMFGFMLPSTLVNFRSMITENMISDHTYILKSPVETQTPGAEKFAAHTLKTGDDSGFLQEDVTVYGVEDNSAYVNVPDGSKFYISRAYGDKYHLKTGDTFTLFEKYEDKEYEFEVAGVYEYEGEICVYSGIDKVNELFGEDGDYFSGYYSDEEIGDIDESFIATIIDANEMTKAARQLDLSLGSMMGIISAFAVVVFVIIIYILSRLIIEKSAKSISLTKILGYKNKEIGGIYILTTTLVVLASIAGTLPLARLTTGMLYTEMMIKEMSGWMPLVIDAPVYIKMVIIGVCAYAAVALFEVLKIRKIPMATALKEAAV